MKSLLNQLYPICRSITGDGVRETLRILQEVVPLEIHEVATGTPVFDWTVPKEWNIKDAWIKNDKGEKVVDFNQSNLHIVSYSVPVHQTLSLIELKKKLYSLPDHPDWIPYRTSYYEEDWGFCLADRLLQSLPDGQYEVHIDSTLENGSLTYGEFLHPGKTTSEILFSTHICHPSLANDNLSGLVVAAHLAQWLNDQQTRYSYRLVFIPGTIGSLTWLSQHQDHLKKIKAGLVLTGVGDAGQLNYKRSRQSDSLINQTIEFVLANRYQPHETVDFYPYGYDERQYCSPGFNLPVGTLRRTPHGAYPQYHTSADNLDFIQESSLYDTLEALKELIFVLEEDGVYQNLFPYGEPQLGKRGIYKTMHQQSADTKALQVAMLWVLNYSDSKHSLREISQKSGITFPTIVAAKDLLLEHQLLKEIT